MSVSYITLTVHLKHCLDYSTKLYRFNVMLLCNSIIKFADDTTILVPQYSSVSMEEEFQHVQRWCDTNKLQINITKTKTSYLDVLLLIISAHHNS